MVLLYFTQIASGLGNYETYHLMGWSLQLHNLQCS